MLHHYRFISEHAAAAVEEEEEPRDVALHPHLLYRKHNPVGLLAERKSKLFHLDGSNLNVFRQIKLN